MRNIPNNIEFNILTQEKKDKLHEASIWILENVGIKITGNTMTQAFNKKGLEVSEDGIVKIPRELVEKALETAPKEITLYNRDGEPTIQLGSDNNIYFGSISEQYEYLDYKTHKTRRFQREDIKKMCKLQDYLPNISFTTSTGLMDKIDPSIAGAIGFIDTVRYYTKSIHVVTADIQSLKDIIEIAKELAGGKEELINKPNFMYYAEPIPPLLSPYESSERIALCAENGIPITYMPYCMMGATSAITPAAAIAQNNAEVLGGLVMSQMIREGAPYIYGSMPTVFDMKSTIGTYGAPEFSMCVAAASEMSDYYNLPFYGTAVTSDAKTVDIQCVSEIEMSILSSMLSKANLVHDVGLIDHARNISPLAICLANEIIEQTKNYVKGVEVNEKTLLLDVIKKVGPGGHFLEDKTTLKGFKKLWYPEIFQRKRTNPEESEIMKIFQDKLDDIMENYTPTPISEEKSKILDKYEELLFNRVNTKVTSK